jgi:hypothetical protein
MSVGVMEDYKLRDLRASHTLGWSRSAAFRFSGFFLRIFFFKKILLKIQQGCLLLGVRQRLPCLSRFVHLTQVIFWRIFFFLKNSRPIPGESSMSPTPSLQSSCSAECVFVGLGDRVHYSSFCGFFILVIC